jgi:hypothetical protein
MTTARYCCQQLHPLDCCQTLLLLLLLLLFELPAAACDEPAEASPEGRL